MLYMYICKHTSYDCAKYGFDNRAIMLPISPSVHVKVYKTRSHGYTLYKAHGIRPYPYLLNTPYFSAAADRILT